MELGDLRLCFTLRSGREEESWPFSGSPMKDKKVLIVDFDEDSLISLSNLVYEEGFTAVTASDGQAGYEKYKADDFNLVIIEPMLPKLHGFELCKKISQDPDKKVPIIVVTGIYREPSCKLEALQAYGASAFFTKPWDKDEFRSKMLQLLVEGRESPPKKEELASPPEKTRFPDEWGLLKTPPPAKEPKPGRGLEEIEEKLRQALSDSSLPAPKKETVKKRKDAHVAVDREVEAMLKGAIGTLGFEEKKKAPEPSAAKLESAVRPAAAAKPASSLKLAPSPQLDIQPEKKDRISIAKEIRDRVPAPEKTGNNIPRSFARGRLESEREAFSIDRTLIEIDKIPLDLEKRTEETEKPAPAKETFGPEKKKAFFDEYAQSAKKKTPPLTIGIAAAAVVIAVGALFFVLKSKKPSPQAEQLTTSVQPSLPAEFSIRQNEIPASELSRGGQTKEEPKKTPSKPTEQLADPTEQIQPALPVEAPPIQLQDQPPKTADTAGQENKSAEPPPSVAAETQEDDSGQARLSSSPTQEAAAPAEKAKPGELVALGEVDVAPAAVKKVGPKYPARALSLGVEGTVTVNALISENGDVVRTEILKGIKGGYGFESSAESAIRLWKFKPAEKDGVKVKVWKPIPINFKLNERPKE
jgi:TonB family protein